MKTQIPVIGPCRHPAAPREARGRSGEVRGPQAEPRRGGYILLVTVLVTGAVAVAVVSALLFLGTNASRMEITMEQSARAMAYARTCMESALLSLTQDGSYAGSGTQVFTYGTCRTLPVGGSGNAERTVCAEGVSGLTTRRIEASLSRILPTTQFSAMREVSDFTLCD